MASMIATVAMVGFKSGNTIFQNVCQRLQPSILAASSSAIGTLVLIAPWNMKVAMESEKPTCMKIRVALWFRTPRMPP